jgi:hypothetical protein
METHIEGTYKLTGTNQDATGASYSGFLHLNQTHPHRVNAEWVINGSQTLKGSGFFHDNTLVINFYYEGEAEHEGKLFKGIVVYHFNETLHTLKGFWSEKHGDLDYLGFENCEKLKDDASIFKLKTLN